MKFNSINIILCLSFSPMESHVLNRRDDHLVTM